MRAKPAGTGPYMFKERQLGRYVLYERAPTPHWKQGTVDWKELQMSWTLEEPTRFAQILAGETHITEVNKDLVDELVRKGYKMIRSRGTAQQIGISIGGLYFGTEDAKTGRYAEHGGTTGEFDPEVPWTKKEVRQAMNKAINREELARVLYKGRAAPMYVHGYYPGLPGWDPTWEKRFESMYGYDPAAAKRLLAQAGYPKGFKAKMWVYPFAGAPELIPLLEAIQVQLREVGIELEPEEADLVAVIAPRVREKSQLVPATDYSLQKSGGSPDFRLQRQAKAARTSLRPTNCMPCGRNCCKPPTPRQWMLCCARSATTSLRILRPSRSSRCISRWWSTRRSLLIGPSPAGTAGNIGHTWRITACKQEQPCQ